VTKDPDNNPNDPVVLKEPELFSADTWVPAQINSIAIITTIKYPLFRKISDTLVVIPLKKP
jgi:hypothetical protein